MGISAGARSLRRCAVTLWALLQTLLLSGCQASLFHALNVTSADRGLGVHPDIVFDPELHLALDIYAPRGAHNLPVVVFFYGGSWQDGKRQWYRWMGEALARRGLVVAIPDYRKYPQVRMAGFMSDASHAVEWVHAHAADYGGDPRVLFLMGHSAGAHMAALLATDGRWLEGVGLRPDRLAGFIGLAGPYDFLPLTEPAYVGMFGASPQAQVRSQPVNFVDGDEPPMLLLQRMTDRYVAPKNACSLASRMRAHGEPVEVHLYPGIGHIRLLLSFSYPLRNSSTALDATLRFIHEHEADHQAGSEVSGSMAKGAGVCGRAGSARLSR
ncbi:alpha/beta hydrolase [Rhodanobacter sp. DHB23]|uniref:alpha/beta hydrolase n=1 Tax=Rhodanobacter sp. DHB23 TaxID=2775923 RepID=UPI001780C0EB|nr:alpha/beta hydrolase [Rhodanobacter sp. DHB23]MBD8873701.1 alpha/beta hydrolase [Rhodanobacter sp. DHB23]